MKHITTHYEHIYNALCVVRVRVNPNLHITMIIQYHRCITIHCGHTYNAFYVVMVMVTVDPNLAYSYGSTALKDIITHYTMVCVNILF